MEKSALAMFLALSYICPLALAARSKFHLLTHLADHVRSFGPASNFNTERFESFNSPIREASVHSNRQAPSYDILTRMLDQELLRHVINGGEWTKNGRIMKASSRVQEFSSSSENKLLMQMWGLQSVKERERSAHIKRMPHAEGKAVFRDNNLRSQIIGLASDVEETLFESGCEVWSAARDACALGSFVLFQRSQDAVEGMVGKVNAIWKRTGGAGFVQVEVLEDSSWSEQWEMRRLISKGVHAIVPATNIVMKVNVVHDCVHHKSVVDAQGRSVRQERRETGLTAPAVMHRSSGSQQHFLLNHYLLRYPPSRLTHTFPSHQHKNTDVRTAAKRAEKEITRAQEQKSKKKRVSVVKVQPADEDDDADMEAVWSEADETIDDLGPEEEGNAEQEESTGIRRADEVELDEDEDGDGEEIEVDSDFSEE
ncbi:unnamed protein product [Tilletia controversa]|nr:unnamed protein product [Tilletia controversa]